MSSSLIPFSFGSHEVRAFNIDGNPWFVGKDVAEVLGYKDTVNALKQHCKGVAKYHPIVDTLGRTQEVRIINEPDTYRLISGSTLPEAVRFEAWLFEEVLPSIRKTGSYRLPGTSSQPLDAALLAQQLADLLKGKVLVDHATLNQLTRLTHALEGSVLPRQPISHGAYKKQPLAERLLDFITAEKSQGVRGSDLSSGCRAYRNATDQEREAVLNLLLDQGVISQVQPPSKPGARRKALIYVAQPFVREVA